MLIFFSVTVLPETLVSGLGEVRVLPFRMGHLHITSVIFFIKTLSL